MKKSNWLEKYENEVKGIQEKGKSSKKLVLVIVLVMFIGIFVMAMVNGAEAEVDITPYLIGIGAVALFIVLMVAVLAKKSVTKDAAKGARENLEKLLTTEEQVEEFDLEMLSKPLCEFVPDNTSSILFTEHYLAVKFNDMGLPDYRFARLSDIVKNDFAVTKDAGKVLGKLYMVDLLDANGNKLVGISVSGKKKMEEFEGLLTKYCPGIQLKEHTLF